MRTSIVVFALVVCALVGRPAAGQTVAGPGAILGWTLDVAGSSAAGVSAFTYRAYVDGAATGVVLVGPACTGTATPYACQAPLPTLTPGPHAITLSAANAAGEGPKSAAFAITVIVAPPAPTNLRILPPSLP
jgi:hypothetical protein